MERGDGVGCRSGCGGVEASRSVLNWEMTRTGRGFRRRGVGAGMPGRWEIVDCCRE